MHHLPPPPTPAAEHMAAAGFFGSLSILQLLATSLLQVQLGGGERSKAAAVDRIGLVMKAVWGARPAHALKQRLERQHWVPRFPAAAAAAAAAGGRAQAAAAGTSPAEQAQRECQQGIMQDFEEYCGLEGQAALDAIWEAAATLRLAAVSSMQSPSKAQLQAALCDAQALLDRCTSTPATARHLTSLASAGTVAANLSQWLGLPLERRQALVALLEEALARADAQKCEYRGVCTRLGCALALGSQQLGLEGREQPGGGACCRSCCGSTALRAAAVQL